MGQSLVRFVPPRTSENSPDLGSKRMMRLAGMWVNRTASPSQTGPSVIPPKGVAKSWNLHSIRAFPQIKLYRPMQSRLVDADCSRGGVTEQLALTEHDNFPALRMI